MARDCSHHQALGEASASHGEPEEAFEISAAPREIRAACFTEYFKPQTLIIQKVLSTLSPPGIRRTITSVVSPDSIPITMSVFRESRAETLRHYIQILANAMPGSHVYFNCSLDTLTLHPSHLARLTRVYDTSWRAPRVTTGEVLLHVESFSNSFGILKSLLAVNANNLVGVQSIALAGFFWPVSDTGSPGNPQQSSRSKLSFQQSVHDGFQNLRELILVLEKEPSTPTPWRLDLRSDAGKAACRHEITLMFQQEQLTHPHCTIPEITFVEDGDPKAPNYQPI